jgi:hypothetical protein
MEAYKCVPAKRKKLTKSEVGKRNRKIANLIAAVAAAESRPNLQFLRSVFASSECCVRLR